MTTSSLWLRWKLELRNNAPKIGTSPIQGSWLISPSELFLQQACDGEALPVAHLDRRVGATHLNASTASPFATMRLLGRSR